MEKITCAVKTIWYSLRGGWPFNYPIMGHDYVLQEDGSLICEVCGHKSL